MQTLFLLTALLAAPALAQTSTPSLDYLGFGWESGGLPPSNPGDVLEITGTVGQLDPIFGIDLGSTELSFRISGLVSTGEVPLGGGITLISYVGGTLEMYLDSTPDADWGVLPPNAVSPSTFTDGTLYFSGSFTDFSLFRTAAGDGSYEGHLDGLGGDMIGAVCSNCAYTWGGAFTSAAGAQLPDGYDLQIDGVLEIDGAVSNENKTWGDVKSLYGN
jgi:hypothetical protein